MSASSSDAEAAVPAVSVTHRFSGRVALVTGAAAGLGRACAQRLAAEGARVAVADIDAEQAAILAGELRGAIAVGIDVRDPAVVDGAFEAALASFGRIDVVVNNAGIVGPRLALHQTGDDAWRAVMAVNADGAFHVLRRAVDAMLHSGGGAIVNMASSTALSGKPDLTPYTFAKAGLVGLTRSAAIEYATQGIRVNAVAPTAVVTELVRAHIAGAPDPDHARELIESQTPIPGLPSPEDVAAAVAFLASDDARWITGHVLPVDGGFHAR